MQRQSGIVYNCVSAYKVQDYRCQVTGCTVKMGKTCIYISLKCANFEKKLQTITFRCPTRLKAQVESWREKSKKFQAKSKKSAIFAMPEKEPEAQSNKIEMYISLTL